MWVLKDPLYLLVGKEDKRVKLGEGNHRFQTLKELDCKNVPVMIEVKRKLYTGADCEPRYYEYVNYFVTNINLKLNEAFSKLGVLLDVREF